MEDTIVTLEKESAVQIYSENQQSQWGDSVDKESVIEVLDRVNLNIRSNSLEELRVIWKGWSPQRRLKFSRLYGHIGFLLHVFVNLHVIEVLVEFWNPSYCCFTMDGVDMAPTIEEYTSLLHLAKLTTPYKTYVQDPRASFVKELHDVIGVKIQKTEDTKITWPCLKRLLEKEDGEEAQMHMLALAIYGLIIFPKEVGTIDQNTISFVAQVKEGINPIPGILAETFRSLHECQVKRHTRMRCCVPLLYVWIMSHLPCTPGSFRTTYSTLRIPLAEFETVQWEKHANKFEWKSRLRHLVSRGLVWQAPWMGPSNVIYRCGNLPWVPLLGPWGGIAYAPLMLRRQIGATQFIPMTHGLANSRFSNGTGDDQRRVREFTVAWRHVYLIESGHQGSGTQRNYELWLANRVNSQVKQMARDPIAQTKAPAEDIQENLQEGLRLAEEKAMWVVMKDQQERQKEEKLVTFYRRKIK
ncbi:uncharacterized protein LOC131166712 [Malania oleifera]|uniref:uncharacterized protein LOC131166712 n=1 Tax=Malania oleifera TaxID=397392 RepID=UPI0025AE56D1|nr:uncharacterized protein LOC131166712 [Malania oleifera]